MPCMVTERDDLRALASPDYWVLAVLGLAGEHYAPIGRYRTQGRAELVAGSLDPARRPVVLPPTSKEGPAR